MAFVIADRVQETCSAPGTGTVSLLGAVTGFQTFSSGVGDTNTTYYCIADQSGANWEVGIGTYTSSGSTLSRDTVLSSSAGAPTKTNFSSGTQSVFVTYPSETAITTTGIQTLTNKTITSRVNTVASSASITIDSDTTDLYTVTALATNPTFNAPSGTPTQGQKLLIRIKDDGTGRTITWTTGSSGSFRAIGVTLPTSTTASKTTYVGCIYNTNDSRWDATAVATEA